MWLSQLQVTNPQAYQMEVQRQQLQAAVDQMEAALKDPVQGPDNVSIYKQYWDQYSGSLEALSKENPMMHHLLQHFRNNWWHLVPVVKEEPAEDQPLSTVPSIGSTSREISSGATYPCFLFGKSEKNCISSCPGSGHILLS